MSQRIINGLEIVNINDHQTMHGAFFAVGKTTLHQIFKRSLIIKLGQGVSLRLLQQFLGFLFLMVNVYNDPDSL